MRRMRAAFLRPLKRAPTGVQAVLLHIPIQGYLPPGRRQDKRHRDVRESERSLEGGMQWRGRVKQISAPGSYNDAFQARRRIPSQVE